MSSLVTLQMLHYPVKDADLEVISLYLPLLQFLQIQADNSSISNNGIRHLKKLNALKQLKFGDKLVEYITVCFPSATNTSNIEGCYNKFVDTVSSCLLFLPNVDTQAYHENYRLVHHEFPLYQVPTVLGLECLVLQANSSIPANVILPNVSKIVIKEVPLEPVTLHQFKKLRDLDLRASNLSSYLKQDLVTMGHQLRKFSAYYLDSGDLQDVLQLCPNLHELHHRAGKLTEELNLSLLATCIKEMRILKLYIPMESKGLLHLILTSCPHLEVLDISNLILRSEELDLLAHEVKAGTIVARKLQKLRILAIFKSYEELITFAGFATELCLLNCKSLKNCEIDWFDYIDYMSCPCPEVDVLKSIEKEINNFSNKRSQ